MPRLLLLTRDGCLPCARMKRLLAVLRAEDPSLDVEEVDYASPRGVQLALQHSVLAPPAVLMDGRVVAGPKTREPELRAALLAAARPGGA